MTNQPNPSREHDPALAARLERLAARRTPTTPTMSPQPTRAPANTKPKRRHPAQKSRVAALALSLATTGALSFVFASSGAATTSATAAPSGIVATSPTSATPDGFATATTPSTPATTAASAAPVAATVSVNGSAYTNKYGAVQVQAQFDSNGQISSVNVLQSPTGGKSSRINAQAVPVLNSEALTAQSATVHTVSGATYTSQDYAKSLQSAIDSARASGITQLA